MLYALQTHMNGTIGEADMRQVADLSFDMCRVDAQAESSIDLMLEMVEEVHSVGLIPHVIVDDFHKIERLPEYAWCSWGNEPDIELFGRPPTLVHEYAAQFREAQRVAAYSLVKRVGGPVCSNLNKRGFQYLEDFLKLIGGYSESGWCDMHRYGDGSFTRPHYDFRRRIFSRDAEYTYLKKLIGATTWGISETGYPTLPGDITEAEQAQRIAQEFALAEEHGAAFVTIYQRIDGPENTDQTINHFGIRRHDGSLKPSAYVVREMKGLQ